MPLYVYQTSDPKRSCEKCRDGFELAQSMKDRPLEVCPGCSSPVMRVIQPAAINTRRGRSMMSKDNLMKHGFKTGTQLLEEGKFKAD